MFARSPRLFQRTPTKSARLVAESYWEGFLQLGLFLIMPFYMLFYVVADLDTLCILFCKVNWLLYPSTYCFRGVADLYHLVVIFVYPVLKLMREIWNLVVKVISRLVSKIPLKHHGILERNIENWWEMDGSGLTIERPPQKNTWIDLAGNLCECRSSSWPLIFGNCRWMEISNAYRSPWRPCWLWPPVASTTRTNSINSIATSFQKVSTCVMVCFITLDSVNTESVEVNIDNTHGMK